MLAYLKRQLEKAQSEMDSGPSEESVMHFLRRSSAYDQSQIKVTEYRAEIAELWRLEALFWRAYALYLIELHAAGGA
jgi:hypothetical protein